MKVVGTERMALASLACNFQDFSKTHIRSLKKNYEKCQTSSVLILLRIEFCYEYAYFTEFTSRYENGRGERMALAIARLQFSRFF